MDATSHRLLAAGAIAGGLLRVINAFTMGVLSAQMLQISYAMTDLLMLIGLAGILLTWRGELQRLGYIGAGIAALGLVIIRGTGFTSIAMQGTMIGAGVAVIGVAILGADMLWRRIGSWLAPVFWILSFVLAIWGALGGQMALQTLAGILFGAGFVFAGIDVLRVGPAADPRAA
jgi:hypothetical protein